MQPKRRIIDDALYAHFVTFSVAQRRQLLALDHPKRIILSVLRELREEMSARCVGFVIMPDHVHAIVWFPEPGKLSRFMQEWKRRSSILIRRWYQETASHYLGHASVDLRFWLPRYYSFEVFEQAKLEEKLEYTHLNPVRRGLVERATDWRWSSARWYADRQSVGVEIEPVW